MEYLVNGGRDLLGDPANNVSSGIDRGCLVQLHELLLVLGLSPQGEALLEEGSRLFFGLDISIDITLRESGYTSFGDGLVSGSGSEVDLKTKRLVLRQMSSQKTIF